MLVDDMLYTRTVYLTPNTLHVSPNTAAVLTAAASRNQLPSVNRPTTLTHSVWPSVHCSNVRQASPMPGCFCTIHCVTRFISSADDPTANHTTSNAHHEYTYVFM